MTKYDTANASCFYRVCFPISFILCCAARPPWRSTQSGYRLPPGSQWAVQCPVGPGTGTTPFPWRSGHSEPAHSPPSPHLLQYPLKHTVHKHVRVGEFDSFQLISLNHPLLSTNWKMDQLSNILSIHVSIQTHTYSSTHVSINPSI